MAEARLWNDPDQLRQLHEQCLMTEDNCRSGTKCVEYSKGQLNKYFKDHSVPQAEQDVVDFGNGNTVGLCTLKTEAELGDVGATCKGSGDCAGKLVCDERNKKCEKFTNLVADATDVGVSVFSTDAPLVTCDYDWECPEGTACKMTKNPEINVCASLHKGELEDKYGKCRVIEALSADKSELVPRIEKNRSSCVPGTAHTVDWSKPVLDCTCCTMQADPSKRKCGSSTPIVPYAQVLKDNLELAKTLF